MGPFAVRRIPQRGSLLSFLVEVGDLEFEEPFPTDVPARLRHLVSCAAVTYQVADLDARHFDLSVGIGPGNLGLVAEGKTNAQIAAELWVAPGTVKKHLEHVYEKIGASRRTAAAMLAPIAYGPD